MALLNLILSLIKNIKSFIWVAIPVLLGVIFGLIKNQEKEDEKDETIKKILDEKKKQNDWASTPDEQRDAWLQSQFDQTQNSK
jgi:type III secretory pathway component EscV